MMNKIKLENPILINGVTVQELTYDFDEITPLLYTEADAKRQNLMKGKAPSISLSILAESDYSFHLYLGMAAVLASNPEIDWNDMERIRGIDVRQFMHVGRTFFTKSVEDSTPSTSEAKSEITQESTTQE